MIAPLAVGPATNPALEAALKRLSEAERRIGRWQAGPTPLTLGVRARWDAELVAAETEAANARVEIRRLIGSEAQHDAGR